MTLMTQLLLFTNNNVTESMRTIKQNIRPSYLDSANNESPYNFEVSLVDLESKMLVNKLKQKRNVSNPAKNSHNSNKPMFDQRSVYYRE